ncbi:hypothetical protein KGF56_002343 [Candida oxycetoniae]|uniref:G-patch domain-containing protein n=1 Tax=Candida oxycetoniae TaxID=497107 RepID=A0AAI9SY20_9ASCO|nr:uncharacterized protein KGF56_002343 [Candida oxycetoniae]KAI3404826.2 hypothetical protein KGF56_002343 [Candida oxycetoniae]
MDAKLYLQSFGWEEGQPLKKGGLKKPILVKHKKDTKGLGHDTNNADMWWEQLFDGQLKTLQVDNGGGNGEVLFRKDEVIASTVQRSMSPLYRMFVKGQGLAGTMEKEAQEKKKDDEEKRKKKDDEEEEEKKKKKDKTKDKEKTRKRERKRERKSETRNSDSDKASRKRKREDKHSKKKKKKSRKQ